MQHVQSTAFESYHDSIWKVFWSTINIREMQHFKVAISNHQSINLCATSYVWHELFKFKGDSGSPGNFWYESKCL